MNQFDLEHNMVVGLSVSATGATVSINGASVDCRDCGPEIVAIFNVGPGNPGNDTTIDWLLQESNDLATWVAITGATGTQVLGDATGFECRQYWNRSRRYVRAVCTIAGTSPVVDVFAIVAARLVQV